MARYPLFVHPDVDAWVEDHPNLRRRADWLLAELAARGVAGRPKGVVGEAREVGDLTGHRWRRSGLGGFDYYAWWFEAGGSAPFPPASRVVRAIRPHDQVEPLALGDPARLHERGFEQLEPLTDEQAAIVRAPARVRLAVGHPGTGKTGALLFAVVEELHRRPGGRLFYVTLSSRLAEDARQFLEGLPELDERVEVWTYESLLQAWGPSERRLPAGRLTDEAEEQAFLAFLRDQPRDQISPWQRAHEALWSEVRAHLVGRALPFQLEARQQPAATLSVLDRATYLALRQGEIGISAATTAWRLGQRFIEAQQHPSLHVRARQVLERLERGALDGRLRALDGLVVDELQDLTLLQQAVLVEAVRRIGQLRDVAPCFVAAGDESQVVHPSGFDWGISKDLLRERLGTDPQEFELRINQRSPAPLVEVANRTARLYDELPREHRPRARVEAEKTEAANGQVYVASQQAGSADVRDWLAQLRETPGSAVVVAGPPPAELSAALDPAAGDLLYTPAQLKGLDRNYVVVWQASRLLGDLRREVESARARGERLRYFTARRAVDEFRVAVSRSTEMLVFFDPNGDPRDPLLDELIQDGVAEAVGTRLLIDALAARPYDPLERTLAYFQEAEELLEADLERALRALDRADGALANLRDPEARRQALQRRVEARRRAAARLLEQPDVEVEVEFERVADQLRQAERSYRELGDEIRATQHGLLVERFETCPPGSSAVAERLPSLFSRYVETLAELPRRDLRARMLMLPREWRDELAALEWRRIEQLRRLVEASEQLAELSGAESDTSAAQALRERLGRLLIERRRFNEALETLQALPTPPPELGGRCCEALERYLEAASWYEQAGDHERAIACFRRAGNLPEAARLAASLGKAELAAALDALRQAEQLVGKVEQVLQGQLDQLEPGELQHLAERLRSAAERLRGRGRRGAGRT